MPIPKIKLPKRSPASSGALPKENTVETRIGDYGFDPRYDPRVNEQDKLNALTTRVERRASDQIPELYLPDYEGQGFVSSMSDRTAAGGMLVDINGVPLKRPINLRGGQDYMFENPGQVWASAETPTRAIMMQAAAAKALTGKDPLYLPWRMAPTGGDFAHMTGETMLSFAESSMGKGAKRSLDKQIKQFIPDWKGVDSPESINQYRELPDASRKAMKDMMDKQFRDRGGLGIGEARLSVSDPKQLAAPEGYIMNVGRIFADKPMVEASGHPSYPKGIPGEGLGRISDERSLFELNPREFPRDKNIRKQLLNPESAPTAYENLSDVMTTRSLIDPREFTSNDTRALQMKPYYGILTEELLRKMGYADGGMVNSAPEEAIKNTVTNPQAQRMLDMDLANLAVMNQPQRMAKGGKLAKKLSAPFEKALEDAAVKAAERGQSADRYNRSLEQGYEHGWYHGGTGDITSFDPGLLGESTGAASAKQGFFFARDPQNPPEALTKKSSDPQSIQMLRRAGVDVDKLNQVSFEGHGSDTASGYAKMGGDRTYKDLMRRAKAAEKTGNWSEYEKYIQLAEDHEIGRMNEAQLSVAKYGDARDSMLDKIGQAFYRPMEGKNQFELEAFDKEYQSLFPYGWYSKATPEDFNRYKKLVVDRLGEDAAAPVLDAMKNFESVRNNRMFYEQGQAGANVMPVALRYKNPLVHDFGGSTYRDETYADLLARARSEGRDAVLLKNTYDPGAGPSKLVDVGVVFDPSQIRSKFASFDPEHMDSPDVLKAEGGAVHMADGGFLQNAYRAFVPAHARTLIGSLAGDESPITEKNFSQAELDMMRDAIMRSRRDRMATNQRLHYEAMQAAPNAKERLKLMERGVSPKLDQTVGYQHYPGSPTSVLSDLDPRDSAAIRNTLGRFAYDKTPEGDLVATDLYKFRDDLSGKTRPSSDYADMGTAQKLWTLAKDTVTGAGLETIPSRVGNAFLGNKPGRPVTVNLGKAPFAEGGQVPSTEEMLIELMERGYVK